MLGFIFGMIFTVVGFKLIAESYDKGVEDANKKNSDK